MDIKEEKIYSLRRTIEQRKQDRKISRIFKGKIRLNFALDEEKFFNKLILAYSKILNLADENRIPEIKSLVETENIKIEFSVADERDIKCIREILYYRNYTRATRPAPFEMEKFKIYKVIIQDISIDYNFEFFTSFDTKISKKIRSGYFKNHGDPKYRHVADIGEIIAELLLNKECNEYLKANREIVEYSVIQEIVKTGLGRRVPGQFEERFYKAINKELADIEFLKSINLRGHYTCDINKVMYLLDLLENKDLELYGSLRSIYTVEKYTMNDLNKTKIFRELNYGVPMKNITLCKVIFKEMAKDNEQIELYEKYRKESETDYAKSFQNKKNIPQNIENAMKQSSLLKYFTYVEYDQSVDIKKMMQIENEFEVVAKYIGLKYMPNINKKREIRFRRLGQHHAAGLYYHGYNCVCVDLDSPTSLFHELSHMLDATCTEKFDLSDTFQFRILAGKYINLLDKFISQLPEEDSLRKQYYGNTKYCRGYYCYHPEIFARCSEIYFHRILKFNSNLVGSCDTFAYPHDEELEKMIKEFFESKVFTKIGYVEEEVIKVPADKKEKINEKNNIIFNVTARGQLSFI